MIEAAIADLLACPCGGALTPTSEGARCEACRRTHPIRDGILDFLAEQPVEPVSGKEGA